MINPLLSLTKLGDCIEVFITALGEASKNISIGFIRQGANFIKTDYCGMQLLVIIETFLPWIWVKPLLSTIFKKFLSAWMMSQDMKKISSKTNLVSVIPLC